MNTRRSDPRDIVDDSIWFSPSRARGAKRTPETGLARHVLRLTIVAALASTLGLAIWWS
jgi:hypothetical protein